MDKIAWTIEFLAFEIMNRSLSHTSRPGVFLPQRGGLRNVKVHSQTKTLTEASLFFDAQTGNEISDYVANYSGLQ